MSTWKKKLLQYGICGLVGAVIAYFVMDAEGLFLIWGSSKQSVVSILCDAFFVPGILLTMFGCLLWIANTGFFDSLGYAVRTAAHLLIPFRKTERKTFYDYKEEKAEKRGKTPTFIGIVGGFYLLLSAVFLVIFYMV